MGRRVVGGSETQGLAEFETSIRSSSGSTSWAETTSSPSRRLMAITPAVRGVS